MLPALLLTAPVDATGDAPPWWFLASIVLAILAAALFTMRLALQSNRKRRRPSPACPTCRTPLQPGWVRCPGCGGELGARPIGAAGAAGPAAPLARPGAPPQIEFRSGPLLGRVFPLDHDVTTIGSVDGNTVVLQDTGVSRKHVGIRKVDGGFELADLGSTNGVYVNGEKTARRRLVAGDVLRIGTSEAVFQG